MRHYIQNVKNVKKRLDKELEERRIFHMVFESGIWKYPKENKNIKSKCDIVEKNGKMDIMKKIRTPKHT